MNKLELIKTAEQIHNADQIAIDEYNEKTETILACLNSQMIDLPDLDKIIGPNNITMMKNNHQNHLDFILSIMKNFDATVLVETIIWVFRAYQNHGFSPEYWNYQLKAWKEVIQNNLSEHSYKEISPIYNWMYANIANFTVLSK